MNGMLAIDPWASGIVFGSSGSFWHVGCHIGAGAENEKSMFCLILRVALRSDMSTAVPMKLTLNPLVVSLVQLRQDPAPLQQPHEIQ
jgi:hypothetical protein